MLFGGEKSKMTQALIFEIISDVIFSIIFPMFYASVLTLRVKKWKYVIPMVVIFSVFGPVLYILKTPQPIVFVAGVVLNLTAICFFSSEKPLKKIIFTFIPYMADIIISLIYISLRTIIMPGWEAGFGNGSFMDVLELALLLLGIILALFIISSIIRRKKPKTNDLTAIYLLTVLILQIFLVTFIMYVYYTEIQFSLFILVIAVYMLISTAITLWVVRYSLRLSREQSRQELIVDQYKFMTSQYEQLRNSYVSYKKLRHDLKEHINVINGLALQGKTDELKDYIGSLTNDWESLSSKTFCDVPAVDIVIADKYNIARAEDIEVDFAVNGIKEANIDDIYLCSIISNLLNNALEAAALCVGKRYVSLHSGIVMGNLVITCRNSCSVIRSEKANPQNHGYGLRIINDFTRLLGGNFVYERDKKTFTAIVTIPVHKTEGNKND